MVCWPHWIFILASLVMLAATGCEELAAPQPKPPINEPCERPKLLAFTAVWCGPCQQQKAHVDEIEAAGVQVTRIDIDQQPDLARQYGVTAVPTYFYYECNQSPVKTHQAADILQRIRNWRR